MRDEKKVEIVSEGTNAQGNDYTIYSNGSFKYENKDGSTYYENPGEGIAFYK